MTDLLSDTSYYYRIVGVSSGGTGNGSKVKFLTPAAPFLAVTPPNQNLPAPTGTADFTVNSNTTWTVSGDAAWCTVNKSSGANNDTIKATCQENLSVSTRLAHITVVGLNAGIQTVTVTQEGAAPILSVNPMNINVNVPAGDTAFSVISNTTWAAVTDAAWCTVTLAGSMNGKITATYQENTVITSRICTVTVTSPGVAPQTVTITQAGAAPFLSVTPPNQNVAATAGSTSFTVSSNTTWTVTGTASWCTFTQSGTGNGTIVADYTPNGLDQARIASLDVTAGGIPVQTVTVTQARSGIGMDEQSAHGIRIFPNPTRGIFRITPANRELLEVTIQDMNGKVILEKKFRDGKEYVLDLSGAAQGTYNLTGKSAGKSTVLKLVIIR